MTPHIVYATKEHAKAIAARMRQQDADECFALFELNPTESMEICMRYSDQAWTWLVDGEPACMFGYSANSLIGNIGIPWLMTTDLVDQHPMTFIRYSRPMMEVMLGEFGHLENIVDARYTKCIRWLKWCGCTIHEAKPFGALGLPFCKFELKGM